MVIDPGKWQPGINCERELREFSGGDEAVLYPDGALSCIGICLVEYQISVVCLRFVHFNECIQSKVSIPHYLYLFFILFIYLFIYFYGDIG